MGIRNWVRSFLGTEETMNLEVSLCEDIESELKMKRFALDTCINLIGNTFNQGELQVFEDKKQEKADLYYLLNVRPNKKQTASLFWKEVIYRLVYFNECLIIHSNTGTNLFSGESELYIADSFEREIQYKATSANRLQSDIRYKEVSIDSKLRLSEVKSEDVLYLQLNQKSVEKLVTGMYASFSELMALSMRSYKQNNSRRAVVEINASMAQTDEDKKKLEEQIKGQWLSFLKSDKDAIMPKTKGFEYEELDNKKGGYKNADTRDYKALVEDVLDLVATSLHIPPSILKGDKADMEDALTDFITFSIKPLGKQITEEINSKFFSKKEYLAGHYVHLDVSQIKMADIEELATTLEILFRTGAHTINENRALLGLEELDEDICNERFVSKNYMTGEEAKDNWKEEQSEKDKEQT